MPARPLQRQQPSPHPGPALPCPALPTMQNTHKTTKPVALQSLSAEFFILCSILGPSWQFSAWVCSSLAFSLDNIQKII
jgi:hypothetical protein